MLWYGWVIFGVLVAFVLVLFVMLLTKKTHVAGLSEDEVNKLRSIDKKRLEAELVIERDKIKLLAGIAAKQNDQLAKLKEAFDITIKEVSDVQKKEFEKLISDTDAAGHKLDQLLGISTDEDDTR